MWQGRNKMPKHLLPLSLIFFSTVALADVKPLPASQWPTTVAQAVPHVIATLTPTTRYVVAGMPKENLSLYQGELGGDVRQLLGLDNGNKALVLAACGGVCAVEDATLRVMEAVWEALQK